MVRFPMLAGIGISFRVQMIIVVLNSVATFSDRDTGYCPDNLRGRYPSPKPQKRNPESTSPRQISGRTREFIDLVQVIYYLVHSTLQTGNVVHIPSAVPGPFAFGDGKACKFWLRPRLQPPYAFKEAVDKTWMKTGKDSC